MFIWDFVADTILGQIIDWIYGQIVGFLGDFFMQIGSIVYGRKGTWTLLFLCRKPTRSTSSWSCWGATAAGCWKAMRAMRKNRYLPFGYHIQNGALCVHKTEGDAVHRIYADYQGGMSYREIAEKMSVCGIPYKEDSAE